MVKNPQFRTFILPVVILLNLISIGISQVSTTQYAFPEKFMVRPAIYEFMGIPYLGLNLINTGVKSFDSLDIRLFFNGTPAEMSISRSSDDTNYEIAARPDIILLYLVNGFQVPTSGPDYDSLRQQIMSAKLQRMADYYNPVTGSYTWSLSIPLNMLVLNAGCRFRLDLAWNSHSSPPLYNDIINQSPGHIPGPSDWSWGPKKKSEGAPVDYNGIISGTKDSVDKIWNLHDALYIAIYRKGKLLWGIPPDWKIYYGEKIDTVPPQPLPDPSPYALIANQLDEYTGQLTRDSLNLTISRVRVNQAGYMPGEEKLFYYIGPSASPFSILDAKTKTVAGAGTLSSTGEQSSGQLKMTCYHNADLVVGGAIQYSLFSPEISGTVFKGEIPDLPEGAYMAAVGTDTSAQFVIRKNVYGMVKDALLKYFGIARCGDNSSWFHPACHAQDPVPGGWHDEGDHIKTPQSMGFAMAVLGLCAAVFKEIDTDHFAKDQSNTKTTDGIPDILAETKIGTDFLIKSYEAGGTGVTGMKTDIGDFGKDHGYWGRPEYQEFMGPDRGGPPRLAVSGLGGNTAGSFCAGLAFVGKLFGAYDAAYAAKCITIARELYDWGKANQAAYSNAAMNGSDRTNDDLALAALALWWATKDSVYKNDLLYDKTIGPSAQPAIYPKGGFSGGWFTHKQPGMFKDRANTSWADIDAYSLWGLYRLILIDEATAASYGISAAERLHLIENILYCQIANLCDVSDGDQTITLPASSFAWKSSALKCSSLWGWMMIQVDWMPNRYQAGNITELFCYYDIASRVQGIALPNSPASTDWKAADVKSILLKQLDYMLGLNPWDVSMIVGIGGKNLNHPHHRASNPELNNTNFEYPYRPPVGALSAGYYPTVALYDESMGGNSSSYMHSEISIDATTSIFLPICGMAQTDGNVHILKPPLNYRKDRDDFFRVKIAASGKSQRMVIVSKKAIQRVGVFDAAGKLMTKQVFSTKTPSSAHSYEVRFANRVCGLYVVRVEFQDGDVALQKAIMR
jgi:hypothetical protein